MSRLNFEKKAEYYIHHPFVRFEILLVVPEDV
jgi:hypothetical protein